MTPETPAGSVRPITVLVGALGGQGGGVLAEWLVDAATHAGYPAQSTSIPGVAQRTGATTYYVEIFPVPASELGGREPVLSLLPVPGCIDVLVVSELREAGRMIQAGYADAARTTVVTSTSRTLTTVEKLVIAPVLAVLLFFGFMPQPAIGLLEPTAKAVLQQVGVQQQRAGGDHPFHRLATMDLA